jgi:purine-cytosine permease-like protein
MPQRSEYVIPARLVAVTATVLSLGLLATLAIVVGVKHVDILSTVALALAILAFVVQLIVYIVQSASASQQLADAHKLHGY